MRTSMLRTLSLLALASCALSASAQNLVVNGDFETGDFAGYSLTGNTFGVRVVNTFGTDSSRAAAFANQYTPAVLTQTIATTTGAAYRFSFDALSYALDVGNSFSASFGSQNVLPAAPLPGSARNDFVHYTFSVVATSSSTTLRFEIYNTYLDTDLDNVSVVAQGASSVPGPLAALPFALIALNRRRKRS